MNSSDGTPNFKPGSFITISGANLVVRDGSNDGLITTILNAGGAGVEVNTVRNRLYSVIGGQITVIDGATNTIAGSFALDSFARVAIQSPPGCPPMPIVPLIESPLTVPASSIAIGPF